MNCEPNSLLAAIRIKSDNNCRFFELADYLSLIVHRSFCQLMDLNTTMFPIHKLKGDPLIPRKPTDQFHISSW